MTEFKYHPACLALPRMTPAAFGELVEDIRQKGLIEPITRMPDGEILDGASRIAACKEAGVELRFRAYEGNDPFGFVLSENIHRRHLTASQKAMVVARLAELPRGNPHRDLNVVSDYISSPAQSELAAKAGINRVTVNFAKRVLKKGTANIAEMVDQGHLSVQKAAEIVHHIDPAEQAKMTPADATEAGHRLQGRYPSNQRSAASRAAIQGAVDSVMSMTAQQKVETAVRLQMRKLIAEYEGRVQAEVKLRLDEVLPWYKRTSDEHLKIIKNRKGVMDGATFRKILACLHPDRVQDPAEKRRYEEAFRLFNDLRRVLLSEKDDPTPVFNMPTTADEWDAMKRKATEARRTRRARNSDAVMAR